MTSPSLGSHCPVNTLQLPKQLQSTITFFLTPSVGILHPWRAEWLIGLFFQPVLVILHNNPFFNHVPLPPDAYHLQKWQLLATSWPPPRTDLFGAALLPDLWVQYKTLTTILWTWLSQLHFYWSCCPRIQVIISLLVSTVMKSPATFSYRSMFFLFSLWTLMLCQKLFLLPLKFSISSSLARDKILCGNLVQWMTFCPRHRNTWNERICYSWSRWEKLLNTNSMIVPVTAFIMRNTSVVII